MQIGFCRLGGIKVREVLLHGFYFLCEVGSEVTGYKRKARSGIRETIIMENRHLTMET